MKKPRWANHAKEVDQKVSEELLLQKEVALAHNPTINFFGIHSLVTGSIAKPG
jgi:hypothetical protein